MNPMRTTTKTRQPVRRLGQYVQDAAGQWARPGAFFRYPIRIAPHTLPRGLAFELALKLADRHQGRPFCALRGFHIHQRPGTKGPHEWTGYGGRRFCQYCLQPHPGNHA